jgi:HPr kinase/phosphorylase
VIRHASAVAVNGRGVLILGAAGSGKSSLALGMMALGARLVADDQVVLTRERERLMASAPERIAGLIEARGIGILRVPPTGPVPVLLAVDLGRPPAARLPQSEKVTILGVEVELISVRNVPNLDAILMVCMQNRREPE